MGLAHSTPKRSGPLRGSPRGGSEKTLPPRFKDKKEDEANPCVGCRLTRLRETKKSLFDCEKGQRASGGGMGLKEEGMATRQPEAARRKEYNHLNTHEGEKKQLH